MKEGRTSETKQRGEGNKTGDRTGLGAGMRGAGTKVGVRGVAYIIVQHVACLLARTCTPVYANIRRL